MLYICKSEKWYKCFYLQSKNTDRHREKKHMDTKGKGVGWDKLKYFD